VVVPSPFSGIKTLPITKIFSEKAAKFEKKQTKVGAAMILWASSWKYLPFLS